MFNETIINPGAYTRLEYPTNNIQTKVFTTIVNPGNSGIDAEDEVFSESWTDGAGRVRRSRTEHPGSTGGWSGKPRRIRHSRTGGAFDRSDGDKLRRMSPLATTSRGWLWTQNEYDWKGRPTRTILTDSNGSDGKDQLISYEGAGCAGGQVTTIQSEVVPKDTNPGTRPSAEPKRSITTFSAEHTRPKSSTDRRSLFDDSPNLQRPRPDHKNAPVRGDANSTSYQDVNVTHDGYGPYENAALSGRRRQYRHDLIQRTDDSVQQTIDLAARSRTSPTPSPDWPTDYRMILQPESEPAAR
ncbi:MAG: hypothetical protein IPJ30_05305 [Acidobacteria bacterium]|nr:hypothetical protein [Acidobacteriota bacterium]